MRITTLALSALGGLALLPPTAHGDPAQSQEAALANADAAVEAAIAAGQIPGAVLIVGHGDEVLHRRAFGYRALEPEREAMTVETVFDLASLTKVIATATSVMKLIDTGRVALDATVATYLPEFTGQGKEYITVEQLLLHLGGLIPDNALKDYQDGPAKAWERVCGLGLRSTPGTAATW